MVGKSKKKASKKVAKVAKKPVRTRVAAKKAGHRKAVAASGTASASERIDETIAKLDDWRGETLAEVRKLIHDADPDVVEEWKWMGSPVWSHAGILVVGNAHKDKVKLTFSHGAKLADPKKVFNAGLGGNQWRAIDLHEGDRIAKTAFKSLVRAAVSYNVEKKAAGSRKTTPKSQPRKAAKPKRP